MRWDGETVMISVLLLGVEDESLNTDRRQADFVVEMGDTMFFPLEPGMRLVGEPGEDGESLVLRWKK